MNIICCQTPSYRFPKSASYVCSWVGSNMTKAQEDDVEIFSPIDKKKPAMARVQTKDRTTIVHYVHSYDYLFTTDLPFIPTIDAVEYDHNIIYGLRYDPDHQTISFRIRQPIHFFESTTISIPKEVVEYFATSPNGKDPLFIAQNLYPLPNGTKIPFDQKITFIVVAPAVPGFGYQSDDLKKATDGLWTGTIELVSLDPLEYDPVAPLAYNDVQIDLADYKQTLKEFVDSQNQQDEPVLLIDPTLAIPDGTVWHELPESKLLSCTLQIIASLCPRADIKLIPLDPTVTKGYNACCNLLSTIKEIEDAEPDKDKTIVAFIQYPIDVSDDPEKESQQLYELVKNPELNLRTLLFMLAGDLGYGGYGLATEADTTELLSGICSRLFFTLNDYGIVVGGTVTDDFKTQTIWPNSTGGRYNADPAIPLPNYKCLCDPLPNKVSQPTGQCVPLEPDMASYAGPYSYFMNGQLDNQALISTALSTVMVGTLYSIMCNSYPTSYWVAKDNFELNKILYPVRIWDQDLQCVSVQPLYNYIDQGSNCTTKSTVETTICPDYNFTLNPYCPQASAAPSASASTPGVPSKRPPALPVLPDPTISILCDPSTNPICQANKYNLALGNGVLDFTKLIPNLDHIEDLQPANRPNLLNPGSLVGLILPYMGSLSDLPAAWKLCDDSSISDLLKGITTIGSDLLKQFQDRIGVVDITSTPSCHQRFVANICIPQQGVDPLFNQPIGPLQTYGICNPRLHQHDVFFQDTVNPDQSYKGCVLGNENDFPTRFINKCFNDCRKQSPCTQTNNAPGGAAKGWVYADPGCAGGGCAAGFPKELLPPFVSAYFIIKIFEDYQNIIPKGVMFPSIGSLDANAKMRYETDYNRKFLWGAADNKADSRLPVTNTPREVKADNALIRDHRHILDTYINTPSQWGAGSGSRTGAGKGSAQSDTNVFFPFPPGNDRALQQSDLPPYQRIYGYYTVNETTTLDASFNGVIGIFIWDNINALFPLNFQRLSSDPQFNGRYLLPDQNGQFPPTGGNLLPNHSHVFNIPSVDRKDLAWSCNKARCFQDFANNNRTVATEIIRAGDDVNGKYGTPEDPTQYYGYEDLSVYPPTIGLTYIVYQQQ